MQVIHNASNLTSTNEPRTTGVIALYQFGNIHGSWFCMSLDIEERLHRYQWKVCPISKALLDRVDVIANHEGKPLVSSKYKY